MGSGGVDLGAFNMPTVGDDQHMRQGGVDTLSRLFAIPLLLACSEAAADLISLAEDLEATSPPTATAVPVVPTWTPSPPDPSPAPATPTLAPTPEIAANSANIVDAGQPSPRPRPTSPTTVGTTGGGGSTRTGTDRTHARKFCCRRASSTSTSAQLMPAASKPVHGWPLSPER